MLPIEKAQISEPIAIEEMPQYDLYNRLKAALQNGQLKFNPDNLGEDYALVFDLAPAPENIFVPILNVEIKFVKGEPGMVGAPGMEVKEPESFGRKLANPENHAVEVSGDITLRDLHAASLLARFFLCKGEPHCFIKLTLLPDREIGIDTFLPGVPLMQCLKLVNPTIIIATTSTLYDPSLDSGINKGINFFGNLKVAESDDKGIRFISDLLGVKELAIHSAVDLSDETPEYVLEGAVQREITIIDGENFKLRFTRSDVGIYVKGEPPEPSIDLSNDLVVTLVEQGKENHLVFTGGVKVEAESITGSFTMNGTGRSPDGALSGTVQNTDVWDEPFGIPGITIRQFAVQVGFTYAPPWVDNVGVHANMKIGDVDGSISVLVDSNDPDQFVLAGSTQRITIIQIMRAMSLVTFVAYQRLSDEVRKSMNKVIDVAMEEVKIYIVPVPASIGGVHFRDRGVTIAGRLLVFGWQASMFLNVDHSDGITAFADMDPINIKDYFKVTGAGSDPAPKMHLRISTNDKPELYISARVEFLALSQELLVEVSEKGIEFQINAALDNLVNKVKLDFIYNNLHLDTEGTILDAGGRIKFKVNRPFNTTRLGKIKVNTVFDADTHIEVTRVIRTTRQGRKYSEKFKAEISGDLNFYGKKVTFPKLTLDAATNDFNELHQRVIEQITDDFFEGSVFTTLEEWAYAVRDETIDFTGNVAQVALEVYEAKSKKAADAYVIIGRGKKEAVREIREFYVNSKEVIEAILHAYGHTAGVIQVLRSAGYSTIEVIKVLRQRVSTAGEAAKTLKNAGYSPKDVIEAMMDTYGYNASVIQVLIGVRYNPKDVIDVLGKRLDTARMVQVLKGAGYSINEVIQVLRKRNTSPASVVQVLQGAGYSPKEVIQALLHAYGHTAGVIQVLKGAGYGLKDVIEVLRQRSASPVEAAKALKGAGYSINEVIGALKSFYGLSGRRLRKALREAGYSAVVIRRILRQIGDWFGR